MCIIIFWTACLKVSHVYEFTQPISHMQDATQGQFLIGVWIHSFSYPRLIAISRLKSQVCPTISGGSINNLVQNLNPVRGVHFLGL